MPDILIENVTLPDGRRTSLGIRGPRLAEVSELTRPRVIDATGLVALPGLVDLHTHLREPSPSPAETIDTGTAAAARGGYTAVFAMANTDPVTDTAERVRHVISLSRAAHAEVIPVGAVTTGLGGLELSAIEAMNTEGVIYFSDDGRCVMDAAIMREALMRVRGFGGMIGQHSQDHNLAGDSACLPDRHSQPDLGAWPGVAPWTGMPPSTEWPRVAEAAIVARDVQLARDTGAHVHVCHVSTAESVEVIRWAKARHIPVTAEVTPHHLLLGENCLAGLDTTFKVNPPLRGPEDQAALRRGLAEGIIDVVATDHAPHLPSDKAKPFPLAKPGMVGLEWALAVVIETMVKPGLLDWSGVADRMSEAPARIGQIANRQGRPLAPGEPATLTLVDPTRRSVVDKEKSPSLGRNNPYHGLELPDPVLATFWAGQATFVSE